MQKTTRWLIAALAATSLIAGACGGGDDEAQNRDTTSTTADDGPPEFESGTKMAELQEKGKIVVGTKFDQPGFGLKNPASGEVEGFDVEIAKLIAQGIFGGSIEDVEDKIEFVEAVSKNREPFIQEGKVDIVVATYTINDARKQVVDFAGPYFVAEQDIMVKADNDDIKSVDDLNGKKVCSAKGSTSAKNLEAKAPRAQVVLFDTYSQCAEALGDGRVEAVTTDNTILAGLVKGSGEAYKLVEAPFSDEPYGIGLQKGDEDFREFLNTRLEELFEDGTWADAFERTLGELGLKTPEPPEIDRYTTGGGTSSSTTESGSGSSGSGSGSGTSSTTTRSGSSSSSTTSSTRP